MSYELLWEPGGVVKHFWGDVIGDELALSVEDVAADRRFDDLRFILNDFLDVRRHRIDEECLLRVTVSRMGSRLTNPNIRVMIVALDENLLKMADVTKPGSFPDTNETRGFATRTDAREWYGAQPRLDDPRLLRS